MRSNTPFGAVWAILAVLLLMPGGSANPTEPVDEAPAWEGLRWFAPDTTYAGHAVQAAYAIIVEQYTLALRGHVNVPLSIYLDDQLLFSSNSIHEHDGLHTLVVTPPHPGTLHLVAGHAPEHGGHAEAHEHGSHEATDLLSPARNNSGTNTNASTNLTFPADAVVHSIRVLEGQPWPWGDGLPSEVVDEPDDYSMSMENHVHGLPLMFQQDLRDPHGRLLLSSTDNTNGRGGDIVAVDLSITQTLRAFAGPYQHNATTFDGRVWDQPLSRQGMFHPHTGFDPTQATCGVAEHGIITDPNPINGLQHTWQEHTDIRLAYVHALHATEPTSPVFVSGPTLSGLRLHGDIVWASLGHLEPGLHHVEVHGAPDDCLLRIKIVPNPATDSGTVETIIQVQEESATIGFTPLHDGEAVPHYEFDTRVYGPDETRLVWSGKLHGHEGPVSFRLDGLLPGDYLVTTYPSPQDATAPPMSAEGADGFTYTFTIEAPDLDGAEGAPGIVQKSPSLSLVGVLFAVLGLALVLRRRS